MGGPGSGRRGGRRVNGKWAKEADPANLPADDEPGLSRVSLEPVLARAEAIGDTDTADAIRAELAARTWQGTNPYA